MKRRRTTQGPIVVQQRTRRPIDKQLKKVTMTAGTSQVAITLYTCTYPGTLVGLRWYLSMVNSTAAAITNNQWAIVIVRDGLQASAMSFTDGSDMYTPEANVLAYGGSYLMENTGGAGPSMVKDQGSTKAMRKLQAGDLIQFIALSDVVSGAAISGTIQFFIKS